MDIYVVLCRPIQLNSFQSLHRFAFCLSLALSVSHFRSLSLQPQLSLFISNKHKMNKWIIKWLQVITFKLYVCFILKNPHCNAWFLMQRFDFFIFVCAHIFQAIKHAMPLICHTKRKWFAVLFFFVCSVFHFIYLSFVWFWGRWFAPSIVWLFVWCENNKQCQRLIKLEIPFGPLKWAWCLFIYDTHTTQHASNSDQLSILISHSP